MRQLLLLRHAKSSWDDTKLPDHGRPLNARGLQAAGAMRVMLRRLGLLPDVVLVSSARRTLQTLQALEPWDETPLTEPMDALYLASAGQLLQILHGVPETARSVLLIGHNPGMHELALLLAGSPQADAALPDFRRLVQGYPTCALAEFAIPGSWWSIGQGGGQLLRFLAPRDMPDMPGAGHGVGQ